MSELKRRLGVILLPLAVCLVCSAWVCAFVLASWWLLFNLNVYTAILVLPYPPLAFLTWGIAAVAVQSAGIFIVQWVCLGSITWLDVALRDVVLSFWHTLCQYGTKWRIG